MRNNNNNTSSLLQNKKLLSLFDVAAKEVMTTTKIHTFNNPQELCNTIWSYAKIKEYHPNHYDNNNNHVLLQQLFDVIAQRAIQNANNFTSKGVSTLLWSYATANYLHADLFDTMTQHYARTIVSLEEKYRRKEISTTLWSLAKTQYIPSSNNNNALDTIATRILNCNDKSFDSQDISSILWSYTSLNHSAAPKLAHEFLRTTTTISSATPQELTTILWSLATMNYEDKLCAIPLLQQLEKEYGTTTTNNNRDFSKKQMRQLQRATLWFSSENNTNISHDDDYLLPKDLKEICFEAFKSFEKTKKGLH